MINYVRGNQLNDNSASTYTVQVAMKKFERELQLASVTSKYIRVIVWNTKPTSEHLQNYFENFDLLQLEVKQLETDKVDIIETNDTTYERFIYVHNFEQELILTVFVKVNYDNKKNSSLLRLIIQHVNQVLHKYGLIGNVQVENNENDSNGLNQMISYIIAIILGFILLLFAWITQKKHEKQKAFLSQNKQITEELNCVDEKDLQELQFNDNDCAESPILMQ